MSDNLMPFPDKLERLATRIKVDIDRRDHSKAEWIAATIDLCIACAEARSEFKDDISFGRWFNASGFNLNDHDRAAAIDMGRDIEQARQVLEVTERRSLRHIHSNEFRFVHADKPSESQQNQELSQNPPEGSDLPASPSHKIPAKRQRKPRPQVDKGLKAYDRKAASGEKLTQKGLAREAGISEGAAQTAMAIRITEAETTAAVIERAKEEAVAAACEASLPDAMKKRLEIAISFHKRKLEMEFNDALSIECQKWANEHGLPDYYKKLESIEKMFSYPRNSVMTSEEYKKIMMCLHPDGLHSRTSEQMGEAFRIFTGYKPKMVQSEPDWKESGTMPRTLEEMLARKKSKV